MMAIHQLTSAEGNSPVMRRNPDGELFFVAAMLAGKLLMKARFAKE